MSVAREPRPWPKPVRWLAWLLAVMVVVALGMLTFKRPVSSGGEYGGFPYPNRSSNRLGRRQSSICDRLEGVARRGYPCAGHVVEADRHDPVYEGFWRGHGEAGILLRQTSRGSPRSD